MPLRAAARLGARLIPRGLSVPIVRGPLRGSRWVAGAMPGPGKGLSPVFHQSEPEQIDFARDLLAPDMTCLDIGANGGMYTLLFSRFARRVFSFEPVPQNLALLSKVVRVNRLDNVRIVPAAVSDGFALTSFQLGENLALGRLDPAGDQPVVTVSCDQFCETYGVEPHLLKIDVEGAETAVLRGAEHVLERHRPHILLSVHSDQLRAECMAYLERFEYARVVPLGAEQVDRAMQLGYVSARVPNRADSDRTTT